MNTATTICNVIAIIAIVSSLIVINQAVKNPVNSVLWLIVSFVAAACYLVTAGITFLGLSYIIVYVGAIAVLFLFVVIILNIAEITITTSTQSNNSSSSSNIWPVAIVIIVISTTLIVVLTISEITSIIPFNFLELAHSWIWSPAITQDNTVTNIYSLMDLNAGISNQVISLGITLYSHGVLWLIIISILLILAILVPLSIAFT